jgi:drug/metabolite transporter (DMT)-like permease
MGIIFIAAAILFFVSIFLIFRIFEKYQINNSQAIIVNYLVATIFSLLVYNGDTKITDIFIQNWFPSTAVLGTLFMISFLLFAISTQKAGMAITSVASKMSVVLPVFIGAYLYQYEHLSTIKIIGLIFALLSFYLIFKKSGKEKINWIKVLLPLLIFLFSGANDVLMKYIREMYFKTSEMNIDSEILFVGSLFSISFISGVLVLGPITLIKKEKIELKSLWAGIILGIANFFSALTMFKAMGYFESSIFFPIFNVSIVSLSAIIGIVFFKEKLSKINYIGLILALITILILAIS